LVGAKCFRVCSEFRYEATVSVDEVILVGEGFDVFRASIGADEDHKVLVSACRLGGDFTAEVAVDIFPRDG
jgi:hypothetical protein